MKQYHHLTQRERYLIEYLRKAAKPKRTAFTESIKKYVVSSLKKQYSPEQISGRLLKDTGDTISIETIYQFVYRDKSNGGTLYKNLRWRHFIQESQMAKSQKKTKVAWKEEAQRIRHSTS